MMKIEPKNPKQENQSNASFITSYNTAAGKDHETRTPRLAAGTTTTTTFITTYKST